MFIATAAVSAALGALLTFAAVRKLSQAPAVVATYTRVGVPEDKIVHLAWILLVGAAGLIAGLFWAPIGIAAAIALVVYFILAIAAHVRHGDLANVRTPIIAEILAVAALLLRVATA